MATGKVQPFGIFLMIAAGGAGLFFGLRALNKSGVIGEKATASSVPLQADLPAVTDSPVPKQGTVTVSLPGPKPATLHGPCINRDIWEWSAQDGEILAVGGKVTHEGSLMAKKGLCVHLNRQDDTGINQDNLLKFATALYGGNPQPEVGAHFVGIMGDGAGQFFATIQPKLLKLGPEYRAKVVASFGISRGEDKFMATPACANSKTKEERQKNCKGLVIIAVLKDGDWNIPMKFAHDNEIRNNPDTTTYDPDAFNWINPKDFLDAAVKYNANYCETREKVVNGHRTGEQVKVCGNAVASWTPADVNIVVEGRGGLQTVVSTRDYTMQMPHVLIGIDKWMKDNRPMVVDYIDAALEGGQQILASEAALDRAAEAAVEVYNDQDAAYWKTYYRGIPRTDKTGLTVTLGGSRVNNLADDLRLFGLARGFKNAFASTYTTFGNIVMQQYPKDVESIPAVSEILDTSYLEEVAKRHPSSAEAETIVYNAPTSLTKEIGSRSWHINFQTGKASFSKDSQGQLNELLDGLVIAGNTVIEIQGHTDNVGSPAKNQQLSEDRASAVKAWLQSQAAGNFPDGRVSIAAYGATKPVESNNTSEGRAKNRRVEVRILKN